MPQIDPEIARLFPSNKKGSVEHGLWRIPLFFDRSFGKNRGCVRLRRYLLHMAEMGEAKEALMEKTNEIYNEFLELIEKYPSDKATQERRREILGKYMLEFVEEVSGLIAEGYSQIY